MAVKNIPNKSVEIVTVPATFTSSCLQVYDKDVCLQFRLLADGHVFFYFETDKLDKRISVCIDPKLEYTTLFGDVAKYANNYVCQMGAGEPELQNFSFSIVATDGLHSVQYETNASNGVILGGMGLHGEMHIIFASRDKLPAPTNGSNQIPLDFTIEMNPDNFINIGNNFNWQMAIRKLEL